MYQYNKTINNNNYAVYILASCKNGTLYIGVTSNLPDRIFKHKDGTYDGFTKKYKVNNLVYWEKFDDITLAIVRKKQLKKLRREWKIRLIEKDNPEWQGIYSNLF